MKAKISAHELREILHYDKNTGFFVWRHTTRHTKKGKMAGTICGGYVAIGINGSTYRAHRLAYLYVTGEWPKEFIDHIDGNKANNKFCNLRPATKGENNRNVPSRKGNQCGIKGVRWEEDRRKWLARIKVNYKLINLGRFSSKEEAAAAYFNAAKKFFGEFARAP